MYPVSQAFLNAVKANTRKYYWTGRIATTAGTVYEFGLEETRRQLCENILADLSVVSSVWERIRSCPKRRARMIRTSPDFWLR